MHACTHRYTHTHLQKPNLGVTRCRMPWNQDTHSHTHTHAIDTHTHTHIHTHLQKTNLGVTRCCMPWNRHGSILFPGKTTLCVRNSIRFSSDKKAFYKTCMYMYYICVCLHIDSSASAATVCLYVCIYVYACMPWNRHGSILFPGKTTLCVRYDIRFSLDKKVFYKICVCLYAMKSTWIHCFSWKNKISWVKLGTWNLEEQHYVLDTVYTLVCVLSPSLQYTLYCHSHNNHIYIHTRTHIFVLPFP
jgi:hypothetical protein